MKTWELSADDLALYTVEPKLRAGSNRAAVSISKAMTKVPALAGSKIAQGARIKNAVYEALEELVRPVLARNSRFGAQDTEPEEIVTNEMEMHFGFETYTLSRREW